MKAMNKLSILVALLAGTMIIGGCGDDDSPAAPSSSALLMPMAMGNTWTYASQEYDTNAQLRDSKTVINTVVADTMIKGERWYFLNNDRATPTKTTSDGVYYWDMEANTARLYLASPAMVGSSYTKGNQRYTVSSPSVSVTVPAGTFNAVQILATDSNIPSVSSLIWVAPGVGLVKMEVNYTLSSQAAVTVSRLELTSHSLK